MWKNLLRTAAFFTVFALIFLLISPVFYPKDNSGYAGIHEDHAKGFLAEPENSIDVLFLGDSEAYSAFLPLKLWEEQGITSYVCSTGNQVMYQSLSYLKRVFQEQKPKMVVFETNALYREFTLADVISHAGEEVFPFLRYHDRWKKLTFADLTEPVEHRHLVRDKGYAFHMEEDPADTAGYMIPTEEAQPVPVINGAYLAKIRDFCREQGVPLILVSTPSTVNWSTYYHNGTKELAQELEIPFLDMNLMPEEIPIDWQKDSYDAGNHLNYHGACKVTSYMGQYFRETGLFGDKRQEEGYASWKEALADFKLELEQTKQ